MLLVDADAVERDVPGEQLRGKGVDASMASNPSDALKRLQAGDIDSLILDSNLFADMPAAAHTSLAEAAASPPVFQILKLSGNGCPQAIPLTIHGWEQRPESYADQSWLPCVARALSPAQPLPAALP